MKRGLRFCFALVLGVLLASPSPLWAAGPVRTLSTGIGKEERVAHEGYTLLIVCAESKGPYIAAVSLKITARDGTRVLEAVSEGPWFYADLPAGTYKVLATRKGGMQRSGSVTVAANEQKVLRLTW
jgi:hypothetical protein